MPGMDDVTGPTSGVKLTWDDFVRFPEDGKRHELIDGEHFVTPAPILKHQAIAMNIAGPLWAHLREHRVGRVFTAPFDVIFSAHDVVEPDVIYLSHERARQLEPSPWIKGAPDLVVEIESPSTRKRDATTKRRLYERFGVDEYWLVDPELDVVKVFRRASEGGFGPAVEFRLEDAGVLRTPLLPGFELPLTTVFAE